MATMPSAATITVIETLALLDGAFEKFTEGIAEDRYTLWLGSGISFGKVPGLKQIVPKVIELLRSLVVPGDPLCRFKAALDQALGLAHLSADERSRVNFALPFASWPDAEAITDRLIGNYARLLDIEVDGEKADFLLWNGVDVVSTFADPSLEPDVEHLCIAILILEGVSSEIASANWDGLVEKAVEVLTGTQQAIVACACPEDLRQLGQRARIIKFHGCAVKARADEAIFRPYLVGRQSQIHRFTAGQENAAIFDRLVGLISTKPTLVIGLSAQDADIQQIFAAAQARLPWRWPGDRPSYVISGDVLGPDQRGLLQNVYLADFSEATRQGILDGALLRAYGKPLLLALVLGVLCLKLRKLIELTSELDPAVRGPLQDGVVAVRDLLAAASESDRMAFVRALVEQGSRAIMMFRDGNGKAAPRPYNPLTSMPVQQMAGDQNLEESGRPEAAVATGLLGMGLQQKAWTLDTVDAADKTSGVVRVDSAAGSAKIFFAANETAALRLERHGHLTGTDDTIVIHSHEKTPASPRSPRGAPGRTGRIGPREVSIRELVVGARTSAELLQRFRLEVAL